MASVTWNADEFVALQDDMARIYREVVCVRVILPMMRAEAPIWTGQLRASHTVDLVRRPVTGGGYLIRFRAKAAHAVVVHEGHGVIVPKKATVLRFVTKSGKVVYTKRVRAVAANPWMFRGFQRAGLSGVRRVRG